MAKIIFSEVRTKTFLYDCVARLLIQSGHEIIWIVQNHLFTPKNATRKYVLAYPTKEEVSEGLKHEQSFFEYIRKTDRMVKYFKNDGSYYGYYYKQLEEIFNTENPDIVIGEVGNFHTHLLCFLCREHKKPFYDLMTSRYPVGRFSFHLYDKYHPIILDEDADNAYSIDEIKTLLQKITNREVVPEYMNILHRNQLWEKVRYLPYRWQLFTEYLKGDKYCTHSPFTYFNRRYIIQSKYRALIKISKDIEFLKSTEKKILLYPMQMQPELNLDVWGAKYNNQVELIESVALALPDDWCLVVKLNPKAREDLNNNLIDIINRYNNIFVLNSSVSMKEIDDLSECAISVTGTIALERIMREEPVIVLGDSFLVKESFVPGDGDVSNLKQYLQSFNKGSHLSKQISGERMLRELIKRSVPGVISEPLKNPEIMHPENVEKIHNGIIKVVSNIG